MVRAKLYLPKDALRYDAVRNDVISRFVEEFNGCTEYDAKGHWVADSGSESAARPDSENGIGQGADGETLSEEVTVFEVISNKKKGQTGVILSELATEVHDRTGESAVLYTVEGEKHIVA